MTYTKIGEIEKKITDHDDNMYITTQEVDVRKFCCKIKRNKFSN